MSNRFQDTYRISSTRLQNWDYSWNALYFITINTHGQEKFFGEITNGNMYLSNLGVIADILWYEIKNHYKIVELDAFVVMPNHIHGILGINNPENKKWKETEHALSIQQSFKKTEKAEINDTVRTRHALSHHIKNNQNKLFPGEKRKGNQGKKSLSSIIGSYKSAVSKHAHRLGYRFEWQGRFHDRIIRDSDSLLKARNYIENNIANWDNDHFNQFGSYDRK